MGRGTPARGGGRGRAYAFAAALALGVGAMPRGALAQSVDAQQLTTRRQLLDDAQQASAANDHRHALDLALRAASIQMSPSLRMFIADEQFALQDYPSVFVTAEACEREAQSDTSLRNRDVILNHCRQLQTESRRRLGAVVLHVRAPRPPGLFVRVAGRPVPDTLYDTPYFVAPGDVVIEASAAGGGSFRRTVTVTSGSRTEVDLVFASQSGNGTNGGNATGTHAARGGPSEAAGGSGASDDGGIPVGGVVVAALGVVALGAAGAFALLRQDALTGCTPAGNLLQCDTLAERDRADRDGRTYTYATDVALGVGAVALVGGALWLVFGRGGGSASAAASSSARRGVEHVGLGAVPGGAAVVVGGRF